MMAGPRPVVTLDPAKVRAWRLGRQHLAEQAPATSPEHVARDLVGVQAQLLSAAALSVAIRTDQLGVDAVPRALVERRLIRSWAMRGTLHLFDAADYPTIVAAIRRREMWRRPAWLRWYGLTEAQMEATIEAIGEILDDGRPRTRADLADALERRLGHAGGTQLRSSWGSLLKLAADRGYLCHATGEGAGVAFTQPRRWLPAWRDEDPDAAIVTVVRRYLGAYGPASLAEVRLWWGTQPAMLRPALAELADELADVAVDGARGLALASDVTAIEATRPTRDSLRLLGPFDPLIVSGGLRDRLIPPDQLIRVSRTAGWISPVLLIGGVVAGVWTSEHAGGVMALTVEAFGPLTARQRRALEREAERVAARHGAVAHIEHGPVFPRRSVDAAEVATIRDRG
jgi:hypothetical protein